MDAIAPREPPRAALVTAPFGEPTLIDLARPMTIAEAIEAHKLVFRLPTVALVAAGDGEPDAVMRDDWPRRVIGRGETLVLCSMPRGGRRGNKQIIGLIASLALALAAPAVGGAVASALQLGKTAASIASVAFLAGGSALLNVITPKPEKPPKDKTERVYAAQAASNEATPLEVTPVSYGAVRYPPRIAARAYAEFHNNEQRLHQLFFVGCGKVDVEKIEIGETEAWTSSGGYSGTFDGLSIEVVLPGDSLTLFPGNVVTSGSVSGQEVPDPPDLLGPFTVNAAGTQVRKIAVDFAFPGGLWEQNDKGKIGNRIRRLYADYREIDDDGDPLGSWTPLFDGSFNLKTRTPQRFTRRVDVTPGRYEVRFGANDEAADPNENAYDTAVWLSLRGYLGNFTVPDDCTLLAVRMEGTEELSETSASEIIVTTQRHIPVYDGMSWTTEASSAIAWAAADMLMDADYGLGLSPSQFDLAGLLALDATWTSRGDEFNAVFDRSWTAWDALKAILRAGRAQPVRIGGKIGFVRDQPQSIRRQVFTARNVVRGSFHHRFILFDEEKPDHVIGRFLDASTWQEREVDATLAGYSAEKPAYRDWFGITDWSQAWRESVTEAAANAYRREFVSCTVEWEGKILTRGEPVLVHHPFVEKVALAALIARTGDALTVDRDLEIITGDDAYVILRGKEGREWGPCLVDSQPDPRTIVLDATDRATVEAAHGDLDDVLPGDRQERAHVQVCEGSERSFDGLVVSATPNGSRHFDLVLVNDDPRVHTADGTETEPSPWADPTLPPEVPARPIVIGLYAVLRTGTAGLELDAMWQPAAGAKRYQARISYDDGADGTWERVWRGTENRFTVSGIKPQALKLQVRAIGRVAGPWATRSFLDAEVPESLIGANVVDWQALTAQIQVEHEQIYIDARGSVIEIREQLRDLRARFNWAAVRLGLQGYDADQQIRQQVEATNEALGAQAFATYALAARVNVVDGTTTANAEALLAVNALIGTAEGGAFVDLQTQVSTNTDDITANSDAIVAAVADIGELQGLVGSPSAGAFVDLQAAVAANTDDISANADAIVAAVADIGELQGLVGSPSAGAFVDLQAAVAANTDDISANADAIIAAQSQVDAISATGYLRFSTVAAPTGYSASFRLEINVGDPESPDFTSAGLYGFVDDSGVASVHVQANLFSIGSNIGGGVFEVPFFVSGGAVYIENAHIVDLDINSMSVDGDVIDTAQLFDQATAILQTDINASDTTVSASETNENLGVHIVVNPAELTDALLIVCTVQCNVAGGANSGVLAVVTYEYNQSGTEIDIPMTAMSFNENVAGFFSEFRSSAVIVNVGTAGRYDFRVRADGGSGGGGTVKLCSLGILQGRKQA